MACLRYVGGTLALTERAAVMGILNVTPDSFADGGAYFDTPAALRRAAEIVEEGADILDIGAQSTRPGHTPVSAEEEWARLCPVLEGLRGRLTIPVSVDTYYPEVARRALGSGAAIINDVSGGIDNGMTAVAAHYGAGLVMMHAGGGADDAGDGDAVATVQHFFALALDRAERDGLAQEQICLDPGIGFGKDRQGDLELVARLPLLLSGVPDVAVLVGASRKRVIAACCADAPPAERVAGTIALHTVAQWNGAHILRVHDVKAAVQAVRVTAALLQAE